MKLSKLKILLTVCALIAVSFLFSTKAFSNPIDLSTPESVFDLMAAEEDSVITFDTIRNELSSDGEWIKVNPSEIDSESVTDGSQEFDDQINTEYVWRPYGVDENWNPYTNGHWVYTSCGWMWVSYYSWGWRPYHYGRWWWSPVWGWVWSPGYIWGPSWVVWMYYGDYCGWYPLSPRVRWHHRHWHHGYYTGHIRYRVRHWTFVEKRNFTSINITKTVIVEPERNASILQRGDFASDVDYRDGKVVNGGPAVTQIENSVGEKITPKNVDSYNSTTRVEEYIGRTIEKEKKQDEHNFGNRQSTTNTKGDGTKETNKGTYKNEKPSRGNTGDYNTGRNNEGRRNDGNRGNNNTGKSNDNNSGTKTEKKNDSQNMYKAPEQKHEYKAPEQKQEYKAPEKKNDTYKAPEQKNDSYKAPEQKNDKGNNNQQKNDNGNRQDADKQ